MKSLKTQLLHFQFSEWEWALNLNVRRRDRGGPRPGTTQVTCHKCNAVLVCLQPPTDLKTLLALEMPVNEIVQAGDTVQRDDTFFLDHVVFLVSSTFMSASPQVTDND